MFCKKCGSLALPKNGKLICRKCGYEEELSEGINLKRVEKSGEKKKEVTVIEDKVITKPVTRAECGKCGNSEAEWWLLQTRRADEPETRFFRCTKCGYTWREYA